MEQHEQEASLRLEQALKALGDLDERIAAMAMEYGLGDVDEPPESGRVIFPTIGSGEETDESIHATARDSLRLAHVAATAAICEIEETNDAASAVALTITAARIYGLTRGLMLSWRSGFRELTAELTEMRAKLALRDRVLDGGRKKAANIKKETSMQIKQRAIELAQQALSNAHIVIEGKSIAHSLDARASYVLRGLNAEQKRLPTGEAYKHSTVRTWITGVKRQAKVT
jgi:hypothetical protein